MDDYYHWEVIPKAHYKRAEGVKERGDFTTEKRKKKGKD